MIIANRLAPARARDMTWNGAGGWVIFSHDRHVNFSRTVWITFHCRGTTSRVSVTSSPSLTSLPPPAINLARANIGAASDLRDYGARRQAFGNDRPFLLGAPTPPPFRAGDDLNPRHRTASNTRC